MAAREGGGPSPRPPPGSSGGSNGGEPTSASPPEDEPQTAPCFGAFGEQVPKRRWQRALHLFAAPLRRAHAAAERHLSPHSLAARRLRARKLLRRWRRVAVAAEAATELTSVQRAAADVDVAPAAAAGASERLVLLNPLRGEQRAAWERFRARFASNAISTAKYNLLTFVPRFLFEMFSRTAYIYFLIQTALAWWPAVSPFDPWGATLALAFVLLVAAIKALVEDAKRQRGDWAVNARAATVAVGDGAFGAAPWRALRVGDVVMVRDDEEVPADLLCVYASLPERVCYVQTTNLDGETNLKIRSPVLLAHTPAAHLAPERPSDVARLRGRVLCEAPNANLHSFNGRFDVFEEETLSHAQRSAAVDVYGGAAHPVPEAGGRANALPPVVTGVGSDDKRRRSWLWSLLHRRAAAQARLAAATATARVLASVPLSKDDVLLRGCKLKNSGFVLGVVIYTGPDTRIMRNARRAPFKAGAFDRFLNIEITILIIVQAALCLGFAIGAVTWRRAHRGDWYFMWQAHTGNNYGSDAVYGVFNFLTFWVLFSYLVPISLFVSMEIVKFAQGAIFINYDRCMRDPATGEFALARNTNLNEDLGMIDYIFSDKTGTLTSNDMRLRRLVLDGELYGDASFAVERCAAPPADALRAFDARLAAAMLEGGDATRAAAAEGASSSPAVVANAGDADVAQREKGDAASEALSNLQRAAAEAFIALTVCHTLIVEQRDGGASTGSSAAADATASSALPPSSAPPGAVSPPPRADGAAPPPAPADEDTIVYQGPSPDEVALVDGARRLGVRFSSRSADGVEVRFLGAPLRFQILAVLEFSSERQRMSVVVRRPGGRVTLFCKGADAALLPLLAPPRGAREEDVRRRTEEHLRELSVLGLRTLVLASRDFGDAEWAVWDARHQEAVASLDAAREAALAAEAERGLTLVGATGVEDKLQEGVPDAIRTLLAARIRVWVITGDKQETAMTVSVAAGLLRDPAAALVLNARSARDTARRITQLQVQSLAAAGAGGGGGEREGARGPELVVDGGTLMQILCDASLARAFAALGAGARAVVVCRASPRQKSAVVKLMQRYLKAQRAASAAAAEGTTPRSRLRAALRRVHHRPAGRTLAIGDGANDVAMLQAADVGVGIAGREGRQAVNNADYALGQFRFLPRLLLVHGTLSQYRLARLIKYSFYKNIAFAGLLLFFQFYAGCSGQALYDSISAGLYNVVLTSAPVVAFALLDRPARDDRLLAHPGLYNRSTSLTGRAFWKAILDANVASAIAFFIPLYAVAPPPGPYRLAGMLAAGKVAYTAVLLVVTLEIVLVSRYITALFAFFALLSFAIWFPLLWLIPLVADVNEMIGISDLLYGAPAFWLAVALAGAASAAYRLAWLAAARHLRPSDLDLLSEEEALEQQRRVRAACASCCLRRRPRGAQQDTAAHAGDELSAASTAAANGV